MADVVPPDYTTDVGKLRALSIRKREIDRFVAKVVAGNGDECDLWTGKPDKHGYGQFRAGERATRASRWALEYELGRPLLRGMGALHTCDNPICVNPDHLYEGTQGQNIQDSYDRGRRTPTGANQTHCVNGHEYTPENTYHGHHSRQCRACNRIRMRKVKV